VPSDLAVPVQTLADAEAYAEHWYTTERAAQSPGARETNGAGHQKITPTMTLRQFGELWTSGALAERFPDHVREKASASDDQSRLQRWVYPIIGQEQMRTFEGGRGLELVEKVTTGRPHLHLRLSQAGAAGRPPAADARRLPGEDHH